jgi:hypothetical protein
MKRVTSVHGTFRTCRDACFELVGRIGAEGVIRHLVGWVEPLRNPSHVAITSMGFASTFAGLSFGGRRANHLRADRPGKTRADPLQRSDAAMSAIDLNRMSGSSFEAMKPRRCQNA